MSHRKRRRSFFDLLDFGEESFRFEREPFESESVEGGSGYSISVTYDEKGKPVVKVKTYGHVDAAELRRDIEQRYPGAKIEGLEKQPLIRVVGEKEQRKPEEKKAKSEKKEEKKSLIRIVE